MSIQMMSAKFIQETIEQEPEWDLEKAPISELASAGVLQAHASR
jgi:hypothetical protein